MNRQLPPRRLPDLRDCDVAVVGGGISGVYVAWKLQTSPLERLSDPLRKLAVAAGGRLRVALFETSHRIGGRLFSVELPGVPGVKAELGGMRYLSSHTRVVGLVERFRLRRRLLRVADPAGRNLYYLRGSHFTEADWSRPDFVPPYRLDRGEQSRSPGSLLIEVALRHQQALADQPERYRRMGFWNLLLDEYSDQAYHLIRDAGGYETIVSNWSAADAIPFLLEDFAPNLQYFAIEEGFQELPRRIEQAFRSAGGTTRLGRRLLRIDAIDPARPEVNLDPGNLDATRCRLRLSFSGEAFSENTEQIPAPDASTCMASHVVLAMPRRAIERLHPDSIPFRSDLFRADLGSVLAQPGFKIFAAYRRPWWRTARGVVAGRSVTDLPLRQCYYWVTGESSGEPAWLTGVAQPPGTRSENSILMASYNDGSAVEFWKGLARQPGSYLPPVAACPPGVPLPADIQGTIAPRALVLALQDQLREMHGLSRVVEPQASGLIAPYAAVYRDWTEEPFGGGWHFWKIGVDSARVMRRIQKPHPHLPLTICGEAWSRQQGWVEGALQSAEEVLDRHLLLSDA